MQPHTKSYLKAFDLLGDDIMVPCEVCQCRAVDIHHIIPRSKFGSKTKRIQDDIYNLIALCRECHDLAHAEVLTKVMLQNVHCLWLRHKRIAYKPIVLNSVDDIVL